METHTTIRAGNGRRAWLIAGWLTLSTILNLVDRQTLSILAPFLRDRLQISVLQYSHIVAAFLFSYGIMYAVAGWFVDRVGERIGMTLCVAWWSLCTMATGFVTGPMSLGSVRFLLGMGEPGNYPAALKAIGKWFPKEQRGLAVALSSSGSAVGNMVAAPLIAFLMLHYGWRLAFVLPGALGLVWLAGWLMIYRQPQKDPIRPSEAVTLKSKRIPWADLFRSRDVMALIIARFISDPVSYFYAFWVPEYLKHERGFSLVDIGRYAWIPFVAGAAGGMLGGRISDLLIRRGMPTVKARLRVLYVAAAFAPLGILTSHVSSASTALALMSVMSFIVYCWFINTAALIPDIAPEQLTGSILGVIGSAGSASGFLFTLLIGFLVTRFSSYNSVFAIVGSVHIVAAITLLTITRSRPPRVQQLQECYEA